jgi:hypothetical protein
MKKPIAIFVAIFIFCASDVIAQEEGWIVRCGGDFGLCGLFDRETGDQKIASIYERILPFSEGLAAVRYEGQFGFIDAQGNMIIEPQFDLVGPFQFGLSAVLVGEHVGIVNREGEFMMQPEYARAIPVGPQAVLVEAGSVRIPQDAEYERLDYDLRGNVGADGLWINFNFWSVSPGSRLRFRIFDPTAGGLIWAGIELRHAHDVRYGLFSMERGDWWTLPEYTQVEQLSEGLATVKTANGKTLVVDNLGEVQFVSPYSTIWPFKDGFAKVVVRTEAGKSQYGLLNRTGDLVGNQLYAEIRQSSEQNSWQIGIDGRWLEVGKDGRLTQARPLPARIRPKTPRIELEELGPLDCKNGVEIFKGRSGTAEGFGMMSADGTILIDPKYDALTCFSSGVAWGAKLEDGSWCPVGTDGMEREVPACRTTHYPIMWSHFGPASLDPDPFTSSVMWVRAYLEFACGGPNAVPLLVGDGVQGHGTMPAIDCN